MTYEEIYQKLHDIKLALEAGEISIDEMDEKIVEAKKLIKLCHEKLHETKKNIEDITSEEG